MKNILRITFLLFFLILAGYNYSLSQETYEDAELITLYVGQGKAISVNSPIRVVVNNPKIADVTSVSKDELFIVGNGPGTTNLVCWDKFGEQSFQLQVFAEDMSGVKQRIDTILKELNLPDVSTRSVDSEGKVLLLGQVKTSPERERIITALGTLKDKIVDLIEVKEEEAVIDIDVQVLELDKDASKTLGFSWPGSITLTEKGSPGIADAGTKWSNLFKVLNLNRAAFSWTLDALVQEGKAKILSQPHLACQSGKEAELLVGGEKPILTTNVSGDSSGTEVEYKEYGIKLKIKPTVTQEKQLKLALSVEVSEVGTAETIGSASEPTAKAYPLTKRTASTELIVNDGQSLVIGGLVKQKMEEDIRKTPFLGDLPILGMFFRRKSTTEGGGQGERGNTELYITLTPTILNIKGSQIKEDKQSKVQETIRPEQGEAESAKEEKLAMYKETVRPEEMPSAVSESTSVVLNRYIQITAKRIQDNLIYPWSASQGQLNGALKLGLCLSSTGQLLDVQLRQSSGLGVLDENTLSTVRQLAPFSAFPSEIKEKELCIEVPIVYTLKQQ
jgi:pilus assembly protein CpaC